MRPDKARNNGRCCNCAAPALGGWCSDLCERSARLFARILPRAKPYRPQRRARPDDPAHHDGLRRALQLRGPGCCAFCEERIARPRRGNPGRHRVICTRRACQRAYLAAWKRDARMRGAA